MPVLLVSGPHCRERDHGGKVQGGEGRLAHIGVAVSRQAAEPDVHGIEGRHHGGEIPALDHLLDQPELLVCDAGIGIPDRHCDGDIGDAGMVGAKFLPGEICVLHLVGGIGVELRMEAARQRIPGGWQEHTGPLAERAQLAPDQPPPTGGPKGFAVSFLVRMLFSCLVDADFIATERFYARATGTPVARGGHRALSDLRDRLRTFMAETRAGAAPTPLNALRADILAHALDKAALSPGLFSLTVPTGGGKTLASLSFALEHAVRHGLKRIIYVIPYTSIVEQTADVFQKALGSTDDILEHHASFDWEKARGARKADDEAPDALAKLRRAAELSCGSTPWGVNPDTPRTGGSSPCGRTGGLDRSAAAGSPTGDGAAGGLNTLVRTFDTQWSGYELAVEKMTGLFSATHSSDVADLTALQHRQRGRGGLRESGPCEQRGAAPPSACPLPLHSPSQRQAECVWSR